MNASQTMQLYAHMMVSMLTCMTLIAMRSVRTEMETSALIDEMHEAFSKSPELEEANVLGAMRRPSSTRKGDGALGK